MDTFYGKVMTNPRIGGPFDYSDNLNYAEVFYYMLYGFVDETIGFKSNNATECMTLLKDYSYNATVTLPKAFSKRQYTDVSIISSAFFANVDPFVKSCLWMVDETSDNYIMYGFSSDDTRRILFNLIYHFGGIYDEAHEIVFIADLNYNPILSATDWLYFGH